MKLELLSKMPEERAKGTPLLFIHGAYSSARIWEPFFLPFFARHGYAAYALSLRGHGKSEGRERLATTRLRDYVADVAGVVDRLGAPPVLVGTSMGGLVVQNYVHQHPVAAMVLLASGAPYGVLASMLHMAFRNPMLARDMMLMQLHGPDRATVAGARRALFREDTPDDYIKTHLPNAEPESQWVLLDMLGLDLPPVTPAPDTPILVLGAERDAFITQASVELTARRYGTTAEIFSDMPHAMMLDRDWERVAKRMLEWLDQILPS
ncbi:MAG: alpha/beta hydrolase [Gammaproteobacteria bacterium]|jgi:pimeloyl-ACP methyl ester carboxylesterase